ncbi:hypothetical protein JCM9279_000116 [Rhodotorula babjevae]
MRLCAPLTLSASTSPTSSPSSTATSPSSLAPTTANPSASSAPEASSSVAPALDTHLEPWSGVLGGLLVATGTCIGAAATQLPRLSAAIAGLYSGALVVGLLLLEYAVAPKLDPPSQTACGLYLLASIGCGLVAAVPCALFPDPVAPLVGSLAGLATSVFLLSTRSDALIRPVGLRYILVVGLIAVGFILASLKRVQPHVLLACTCVIGAFVVVLGIDCFASAGLKELYVYVLGLDKLFPKLEGHYRLTTSIIAELAATVALVFIFMAIQSRFLSIFVRRDAEAKRSQRDEAKRDEQLARASRRRSRVELNDWEEKYGAGATSSGASDEQTLTGGGAGGEVDKVRSTGSMASLLAPGALQPTPSGSLDFLPKLDAYPPAPTLPSAVDDFGRAPTRPVLASIQPSQRNVKPEWNSYVSTRKVAIAEPKPVAPPRRASRTLSLFSIGRRGSERAPSVKVHAVDEHAVVPVEDDDDDDVPLAAVRSLSTGALPRPSTMYDLTSASAPNLSRPATGSGTSLAPPPRSRSRMSLAIPAVLAAPPPAASPPLSTSPQRPATLARVGLGRSSTLLDLTAPSTFDPYHDRARQVKHEAAKGPERIAVGERRRVQSTPLQVEQGTVKGKGKAVDIGGGARIMDFGELEDKHRKRLSTLQSTANDKLTSSAALARFQAQQRAEAEAQRKREARRSVDSNLHLLGAGARRASSPDQAQATRKRASASMGSLSGLLKRGAPSSPPEPQVNERRARTTSLSDEHEREEDVPLGALRREHSSSTPLALARPERPRRASTQALVSQQQLQQQQQQGVRSSAAAPVRPSAQQRHSLGTLLEVSSSRDDGAPAPAAAPSHAPPTTSARVDKVTAWRRSGSLGGGGLSSGLPAPPTAVAVAGVGEAALLQRVADKAAPKKKHDWLQY